MKIFILILALVFLSGCAENDMWCVKKAMTANKDTPALTYEQAREACGIKTKDSK